MNLDDFQQRIRWRLVAFLGGLALLLFILDLTGNLDNAFGFVRDPISAVMGWTAARTDAVVFTLGGPRDLQEARNEIFTLEARIADLEREVESLREVQGEYQLLQQMLDRSLDAPDFTRQIAAVIGRDTSPYFRSIIIDKGSDDGVLVGMPVEGPRGLVGQVYRTTGRSAQVLLITDNLSAIPGRLVDSRATGIVHGSSESAAMAMDWISLEANAAVGEVVLTSGLGGRFPPDLIIGRITRVERREAELFQSATIQPAVDFDQLEVVFVITNFRPIDTSIFDTPDSTP
jgi:rod shape-determining protein MreC